MKTIAPALVFTALLFSVTSCGSDDYGRGHDTIDIPKNVPVTGVTLEEQAVQLEVNAKKTLIANVIPKGATNKKVSWISSKPDIASISTDGVVTAHTPGQTTITVTTLDGGKKATCEVKVIDGSQPPSAPNVYVAGYVIDGQGNGRATLWKNNSPLQLSSLVSQANSVFASDNYVYVAGYETNTQGRLAAMLWRVNSAFQLDDARRLTDVSRDGKANAVFVSGNVIYVAGYEYSQGREVATLWENYIPKYLGNSNSGTYGKSDASAVFVSGSDVYVAGYERIHSLGREVATLWKNSTPKYLGNSNSGTYGKSDASAVFVLGNDVFTVGKEFIYGSQNRSVATLWKNNDTPISFGSATTSLDSDARAIFALGNDVYVAGHEYTNMIETATLWKVNGNTQRLSSYQSQAPSAYSFNGSIYALVVEAGFETSMWKDGDILYRLSQGTGKSVFVK